MQKASVALRLVDCLLWRTIVFICFLKNVDQFCPPYLQAKKNKMLRFS